MATIKEKLIKWLGGAEKETHKDGNIPIPVAEILAVSESKEEEPPTVALATADFAITMDGKGEALPHWLADEDGLRDEGVLFGLSESEPTEKTEIIQKYFTQVAAGFISEIEQKNEEIQEYNLFIGQKTDRLAFLNKAIEKQAETRFPQHHFLPRTLLGLALSIVICLGNFFLIQNTLEADYPQSGFIALGVFCAGMFNVFGKFSFFHDESQKANWRTLLEEIGMPVAAALFVFVHSLSYQPFWVSAGLFLFVLFLFLFAGKLMLSNVTMLSNDFKSWQEVREERKKSDTDLKAWSSEIKALEEQISELRIKKWQSLRGQSEAEAARERLFAKRDMLVKIFESEFYLARQMKHQLSKKQLSFIQDRQD